MISIGIKTVSWVRYVNDQTLNVDSCERKTYRLILVKLTDESSSDQRFKQSLLHVQATDPVDMWFVIRHGDTIKDSTEKGRQYWVRRARDNYQDTSDPIRGRKASRIKSDHRLSGSEEKSDRQHAWELTDDLPVDDKTDMCQNFKKKDWECNFLHKFLIVISSSLWRVSRWRRYWNTSRLHFETTLCSGTWSYWNRDLSGSYPLYVDSWRRHCRRRSSVDWSTSVPDHDRDSVIDQQRQCHVKTVQHDWSELSQTRSRHDEVRLRHGLRLSATKDTSEMILIHDVDSNSFVIHIYSRVRNQKIWLSYSTERRPDDRQSEGTGLFWKTQVVHYADWDDTLRRAGLKIRMKLFKYWRT